MMRVPIRWLEDFTDVTLGMKEFAEALTMSGSKVEGVEDYRAGLEGVVSGRILSVAKHGEADRLLVCMVDVGTGVLQIVTGADNVKEGDSIPVALIGTDLRGSIIKETKLRGVASNGMMCSVLELGLAEYGLANAPSHGIYILQGNPKPGEKAAETLGLDRVVTFEITSNRPDCLSIQGIAREASATLGTSFRKPAVKVAEKSEETAFSKIKVLTGSAVDCPRYSARIVDDVCIGPSPTWMQHRLVAAGMRPVNNLVDITNYVMLELGQPMHAFDFDKIEGDCIFVRRADKGETLLTLDNNLRLLDEDMLVIADEEKAIALAGVMGGASTEVGPATRRVLLESATFAGSSVRKTAKRLNLRSEASGRFEKGLDPQQTIIALDRCAQLIEDLGVGRVLKGVVDCNKSNPAQRHISFEPQRINALLGTEISPSDMLFMLSKLEFKYMEAEGKLVVPSFRNDVERMQDLAEEVARFYGYNNIVPSLLSGKAAARGSRTKNQRLQDKMIEILLGCGLSEACTLSLTSPKVFDALYLAADDSRRNAVTIENPLGEDFCLLRTTMLSDMLKVLSLNHSRQIKSAWLFEIGRTYHPTNKAMLPDERAKLSIGLYGGGADFFVLKGVVEQLLSGLGIFDAQFEAVSDNVVLHPGRAARLMLLNPEGKALDAGFLGEVHPRVSSSTESPRRALVAELSIDTLFECSAADRACKALPKYPSSVRDLALVVSDSITMKQVKDVILESGGDLLARVDFFDVYKGGQLAKESKSLAFSLTFLAEDRTLTDEEVNKSVKDILSALSAKVGAELRN